MGLLESAQKRHSCTAGMDRIAPAAIGRLVDNASVNTEKTPTPETKLPVSGPQCD
jgi:hypothetical protein